MKLLKLIASSAAAAVVGSLALSAADVRQGLVSYWPLDAMSVDWTTSSDVVSGNDLNLIALDSTSVVAGKRGSAFQFDGASQYAYYTITPGVDTGLPISKAVAFSILCWVKGAPNQVDRRVLSESNSLDSDNDPLVNLGTHNAGTDGTVDLFFRNSAAAVQLNHLHSPGTAFDNTWHHLALVDVNGAVTLYLDGVANMTASYIREAVPIQDTTSIGAIVRAMGATISAWFAGAIDDVAVWERALSQAEIQDIMNNGVQTPVPAFAPFVTQEPSSATELWVGDAYTLRARAGGTRPLTYQWLKNNAPITGATEPTLALTGLQIADSGEYRLLISNSAGDTTTAAATLLVSDYPSPSLTNQVIAYWPLNEVQGTKTPDIASGFDMDLVNLTAADVVPGKWGNAMRFDLARQTMLKRVHNPGEALPIYQYPNFSVSLWVKGSLQSDKRVFSEGSTKSTQPLFNLGTHNGNPPPDGTLDSYIRTDGGAVVINHAHSQGIAFDDTWHHIAYTQREVGGVPTAAWYIDGVADPAPLGPTRPLTLDTTSIGGILRATPAAWFTGQIDDVVLWNRALTPAEAQLLANSVMPTPPANIQPLTINSFKADLPQLVAGDSVALRWDVSKQATEITIDNGVGDVTSRTVAGAGSITITPAATTTYTLTVRRGAEQLTATARVAVLTGVGANWAVVDNFDAYQTGFLSQTGWWRDLRGDFARVEDRNGNKMLSMMSVDSAAVFELGGLTISEGQERTLFFRLIARGDPTAILRHVIGLTDKNIRSHGDTTSNIGPDLHLNYDPATPGWFPGVIYGVAGALEYAIDPLEQEAVYSVWIDMKNIPMNDPISPYDVFSVYLQKQGEAGRTELFKDYLSDRDPTVNDPVLGMMAPDLNKLFVSSNNTTVSAWFDDFFLSKAGFNATEPAPFNEGGTPAVSITLAGAQVEVSWSGGTLVSAASVAGPWNTVPGATTSPYRTDPTGGQMYYRVSR